MKTIKKRSFSPGNKSTQLVVLPKKQQHRLLLLFYMFFLKNFCKINNRKKDTPQELQSK